MAMILFASEINKKLVFTLLINGERASSEGATVKLVTGIPATFVLTPHTIFGEWFYSVQSGDFPAGQYTAFVTYEKTFPVILRLVSTPFIIISKPDPV